jgi:hypothetical protein
MSSRWSIEIIASEEFTSTSSVDNTTTLMLSLIISRHFIQAYMSISFGHGLASVETVEFYSKLTIQGMRFVLDFILNFNNYLRN